MIPDDYNIDENEAPESFCIDTDALANWAIKKIKAEQAEHDRLQKLIDEEREELQKKQEEIDKQLESKTAYFRSLLYGYFQTVEHKETKTQESYKLLSGSLVYKKPAVTIVRPDDEKLVAYLENAGREDMVETKKTAKWGEVKKTLTISYDGQVISEDGEILDFITTEEKAGEFNVK
jgi:hypothetical protein